MLAYRHAFHAGNHADVLKHLVLMLVLRHLGTQGEGLSLRRHPRRRRRLFAARPLRDRRTASTSAASACSGRATTCRRRSPTTSRWCARFNPDGVLAQYPGSPALAQMLLRPQDELRAFELHPTEQKILRATLAGNRRATVYDGDGFVGLRAAAAAADRGARAVLIDPSYEGNGDYAKVVASLREALDALRRRDLRRLVSAGQQGRGGAAAAPARGAGAEGLAARAPHVQEPDAQGFGLAGSGVFVLNPPHTLNATLAATLPYLVDVLGRYPGANFLIDRVEA